MNLWEGDKNNCNEGKYYSQVIDFGKFFFEKKYTYKTTQNYYTHIHRGKHCWGIVCKSFVGLQVKQDIAKIKNADQCPKCKIYHTQLVTPDNDVK